MRTVLAVALATAVTVAVGASAAGANTSKAKGTPPDKPKCYGVVAKFEVLNGESWRSFKSPTRSKVCPRPKW